jgi:hypothetical protein
VVVQVALSLVLVAGALLFSRSFSKLANFDAGFNQENLLVTTIGFNRLKIEPLRRLEFRDQLLDRVKNVPGVDDAAEMDTIPSPAAVEATTFGSKEETRKTASVARSIGSASIT